jgi:hypothetical protein
MKNINWYNIINFERTLNPTTKLGRVCYVVGWFPMLFLALIAGPIRYILTGKGMDDK